MATLAVRQSTTNSNGSGATTVTATWPSATLSHTTRIAIVVVRAQTVATGPTDWSPAVTSNPGGGSIYTYLYINASNKSLSGTMTWNLSASAKACVVMAEFNGMPVGRGKAGGTAITYSSIEGGGVQQGSGLAGTASSLISYGTPKAALWLGLQGVGTTGVRTIGSPTNSYTIIAQVSSSGGGSDGTKCTACMAWKEGLGYSATDDCAMSWTTNADWASAALSIGCIPPMLMMGRMGR